MKSIPLALALLVLLFFAAGAGQAQQTKGNADPLSRLHDLLYPRKDVTKDPAKLDVGSQNNNAPKGGRPTRPEPRAERPRPKPKYARQPTSRVDDGPDLPYSCGQVCFAKGIFSQAALEAEGRRRGYGPKAERQARACMRKFCPT